MANDDWGVDGGGNGPVSVTNDSFGNDSEAAVVASSESTVTVADNTATGVSAGNTAYDVDAPALDFADLVNDTANSGSLFEVSGTVTTSSTMQDLSGFAWEAGPSLDVPAGVTLTIAPGTVVKGVTYGCGPYCTQNSLTVEGTLDAVGTSTNPITFTSLNDNSIGGATGTGTPSDGDWSGIDVDQSGSVEFTYVNVEDAETGISVGGTGALTATNIAIADVGIGIDFAGSGAAVSGSIDNTSVAISSSSGSLSFRGSLVSDQMGIESCDWGTSTCGVDAAFSYWGSSNGPAGLACGQVTVNPWYKSIGGKTSGSGANTFATNNSRQLTDSGRSASGRCFELLDHNRR